MSSVLVPLTFPFSSTTSPVIVSALLLAVITVSETVPPVERSSFVEDPPLRSMTVTLESIVRLPFWAKRSTLAARSTSVVTLEMVNAAAAVTFPSKSTLLA